jgi:oligoendopeptidase F
LHFYDLYVPLAEHEEIKLSYDEARNLVLEAVKPLGTEYCDILHKGLYEERWVDIYENENKRSGAYSTGSYLTRPYILMNYNGTLDSARTLAHEAGHSMHSWFTHNTQSPTYGSYPIFLAEVASTFNEEMMNNYLLEKHGADKKFKAYLLTSMIEDIRATLFRQTLFAEFELKLHEMAENGVPFTADLLKKEYMDLYRFYYGEDLVLDDELAIEWARIPHFYYDYYVYQYATGISAAIALYRRVTTGGKQELEDYLGFLKAGNSRYPLDILRSAGVDMSKSEPIAAAISYFDELLTELQNC